MKLTSMLALAVLTAAGAMAQDQAKPQVQQFDDWQVRCFPIKSPSPCDMFFATVSKTTHRRVVSISLAYVPSRNNYAMQIAVPYGIALAQGVKISAGAFHSPVMPVRRCDRAGCFVEGTAANDLIMALSRHDGEKGTIDVVADGGKPVSLAISLKGFTPAGEAMSKNAKEKAVAPSNGGGK